LDLEDALFRVLPIPVEISRAAALQFRHRASKGFSLLIDGVVSQGWRRATCTISRLVPVFFERNSQFYFMKFNRQKEEDPEPDLVVHVVTIPVAREVLNGDENSADDPGIDIVDYYLQAGLLIYSHLLPDNSKASWERYTAEPALAPNFESLLDQLEG
jgi:hypothetical protein